MLRMFFFHLKIYFQLNVLYKTCFLSAWDQNKCMYEYVHIMHAIDTHTLSIACDKPTRAYLHYFLAAAKVLSHHIIICDKSIWLFLCRVFTSVNNATVTL